MNKLTFDNIYNESQLNFITETAEDAGCKFKIGPFSESVVVTGTEEQIQKFTKIYTS